MKIIKNFYVGFCFVQTGTRRRYCLVIRLSKVLLRCEMQTLIGPIAITTIMLMCILTMHNAFVVQRCHIL